MIEDTDLYLDKEIHNNAWRADKRQSQLQGATGLRLLKISFMCLC